MDPLDDPVTFQAAPDVNPEPGPLLPILGHQVPSHEMGVHEVQQEDASGAQQLSDARQEGAVLGLCEVPEGGEP
ncbi:MAG: hypothetical protein H6Q00_3577 [Holophagaceae bacterium]|nr:hypothetical protein [Holophagaceae bacterium]